MNKILISNEAIVRVLQDIYQDGDPIRTMLLLTDLTDLGIKHGLIHEAERSLIGPLHQLLAEIAILREKAPRASS